MWRHFALLSEKIFFYANVQVKEKMVVSWSEYGSWRTILIAGLVGRKLFLQQCQVLRDHGRSAIMVKTDWRVRALSLWRHHCSQLYTAYICCYNLTGSEEAVVNYSMKWPPNRNHHLSRKSLNRANRGQVKRPTPTKPTATSQNEILLMLSLAV